jgi:hypothetical protein
MSDRQTQREEHRDRPVVGADLPLHARPGVPMEQEPRPLTATAPRHVEAMRPRPGLTRRAGLRGMTPVFGTAQPLHGLSGLVRRRAYSIRENKARHWMLLLLADRIDVWEHRIARMVKVAALVPVGVGALVLAVRLAKR